MRSKYSKVISVAILLLSTLTLIQRAQAAPAVLSFQTANAGQGSIWGTAFSHDDSELYYGGGADSSSIRRILSTNLVNAGTAEPKSSDGFATARALYPNWQVNEVTSGASPAKNGHYWSYAAGGNRGANGHGTVYAIDQTTHAIETIELKKSDGSWTNGGIGRVSATPDGKYVYASGQNNIFKINALTNTQVGLGIATTGIDNFTVTNSYVYYPVTGGIKTIAIDGDGSTSTGDAAALFHTITWSSGTFDVTGVDSGFDYYQGHIYATSYYSSGMAVIDVSTFTGDTWNISASYPSGWEYGAVGADNYYYVENYDYSLIAKVDLNSKTVVAITSSITNGNMWFGAMNNAGTKFVATSDSNNNALYVVDISATPAGVNPYATGGGPGPSPTPTPTKSEVASNFARLSHPTISRSENLVTCNTGNYMFSLHGVNQGPAQPTRQVMSLLADGKIIKQTESLALHVSFDSRELSSGVTYTCQQTISQADATETFSSVNYSIEQKATQALRASKSAASDAYWTAIRAALDARHASINELIRTHEVNRTAILNGAGLRAASAQLTMKLITASWHSDREALVAKRDSLDNTAIRQKITTLEKAGVSLVL